MIWKKFKKKIVMKNFTREFFEFKYKIFLLFKVNKKFLGTKFFIFRFFFISKIIILFLSYRPKTTHKYITSIKKLWYWIWPKSIEAFKFFLIFNFWKFFQNCISQANFDLSSWNYVRKCTNTEWCLIPNFIRIVENL